MNKLNNCRIVVLLSGEGTNLQAIIDASNDSSFSGQIVAVIANKANAQGLIRASKANIPQQLLEHKDYPSRDSFETALAYSIDQFQPDLVVLAGFMRILGSAFVQHYQGKMLNIHPSLLPKYQGLHTHKRVLQAGDTKHGVSVHFVTEELDGGPLVAQQQISISNQDSELSLTKRVQQLEYKLYPKVINWFCNNRLKLTKQGAELDGKLLFSKD